MVKKKKFNLGSVRLNDKLNDKLTKFAKIKNYEVEIDTN